MNIARQKDERIRISLATHQDRDTIYRLRHTVYARELGQHLENREERLSDTIDAFNVYITASVNGEILGFVSVTPPGQPIYSIDKYFRRDDLPFTLDDGVFEVRLLTVPPNHRGRQIAALLMYAALRWVEAHGGRRIVGIGRREILPLYRKVGLQPLDRQVRSGAVTFQLMSETTSSLQDRLIRYTPILERFEARTDWQLGIPFRPEKACYHGGAFFEAIGVEFDALEKSGQIINADVLDAWFPPAPGVLSALNQNLPWLVRTSPPTGCEGMIKVIAGARDIDPECVVPGAGSSNLIFLAFRQWLTASSRALILDPNYGEYAHVLEGVMRCKVDRLPLLRDNDYDLDLTHLERSFRARYDLIVLVNPNNPTGRFVRRGQLEEVLKQVPAETRVWVDEAYIDYVGPDDSIERFAARSKNIVVSKSMSKVYALSGIRAAYLCAPPHLARELRSITPPWAVSLPAQVAAVRALQDPQYYAERYRETGALRVQLIDSLRTLNKMDVIPSVANFVLCHLSRDCPDAATVCDQCRAHDLFLRNASITNPSLGSRAIRIAVKDGETNRRIVETLAKILCEEGPKSSRAVHRSHG